MRDDPPAAAELAAGGLFLDRELSWLAFARRVLALSGDRQLPLVERARFAGIVAMLHDEFFMKRIGGLKRQIRRRSTKRSLDGRTAREVLAACRAELLEQSRLLAGSLDRDLLPALAAAGMPLVAHDSLEPVEREHLRGYFEQAVLPILTPLAVDPEHPFPFISNDALNLAVLLPAGAHGKERFVRIKVPGNRPRWVPLPAGAGHVPLEQVIAANLDLMFPASPPTAVHFFRVLRGAEGDPPDGEDESAEALREPGSILRQVSAELKARKFAGVVRLQVDRGMPDEMATWIGRQLEADAEDVYREPGLLALRDLTELEAEARPELCFPPHRPAPHPRLRALPDEPGAMFEEIARGDLLLHHPYHGFDDSVLRFLEEAAADPGVLAIKLTIYRTGRESPIVQALAEAARRGKQVAVLVEITARFDEAPNIEWGQLLEKEGVHVSYGVRKLKTHVKLALVVREERGRVRRYAHIGTGNYHPGTARVYEDLGLLTADAKVCEETAAVFNQLTGATPPGRYRTLIVAPKSMRRRFVKLIRREAANARRGRESGVVAKMNQLQDPGLIRELYAASRAGVPIWLIVRGLCCLRPGVPGLSETIQVTSVVGRFLEHSRLFRFANGGEPEYYLGSADWMRRNLSKRVETITPVRDPEVQRQLEAMLEVYRQDNCSAWDCQPDGSYRRRHPAPDEPRRAVQEILRARAAGGPPPQPAVTAPESPATAGR